MKYNLELLKADVADELEKLRRLEGEFQTARERVDLSAKALSNYDRGAVGYLLHNFYNGCENIFRSIARFFENDLGPQIWHADLLRRMKLDIPGYRPPVIDENLYGTLDEFRAFRHRFRHSYGFELDWERERLTVEKLPDAAQRLRVQVEGFLAALETLDSKGPA